MTFDHLNESRFVKSRKVQWMKRDEQKLFIERFSISIIFIWFIFSKRSSIKSRNAWCVMLKARVYKLTVQMNFNSSNSFKHRSKLQCSTVWNIKNNKYHFKFCKLLIVHFYTYQLRCNAKLYYLQDQSYNINE